ncbi:MAG: hypothetical protein NVS3B17_20400 [Vulcanimicrobiaceae bacterium]
MTNRRTLLAGSFATLALAGCANPNFIGLQDYGTVYGNVVDGAGKPIVGALVSATGTSSTYRTVGDGSFTLPQVAVGVQTIGVSAPGYGPPARLPTVEVKKDLQVTPGNIVLPSVTSGAR